MKTAIITLPFHVNYGGYLQAYALQMVLKQMGHKAYVISFSQQPTWRIWISYLKWKILRLVRNNYGVEDSFKDFFMLKINKKFFRTINDIRESDFEAYVVGSDQVWRPLYVPNIKKYRECESIMEWKAFANRYLKKLKFNLVVIVNFF